MKTTLFLPALLLSPLAAPVRAGGTDTIPDVGVLGGPIRPLTPLEAEQFLRGFEVFTRDFHVMTGVGLPDMNADSCLACHQDPITAGSGALELNVSRMGFDNGGQGPFQNVPGGQVLSKLRAPWFPLREEYDPLVPDVFEQRNTPPLFGLGLVDAIPAASLVANEDIFDANNDNIRGRARRLTILGAEEIGRFGWKAQIPELFDFVKDAMGGENGITTVDDGRGFAFVSDTDAVADPELSPADTDDIFFFMTMLGAPPRTFSQDPQVHLGEKLFELIGCARCHIPVTDGDLGPVPAYSNFLLHHVHKRGVFRGMAEDGAPNGFYRTPPLWGIRHTFPYMHDGRAENLTAAINAHFSEANRVKLAFKRLPANLKAAIIAFLEDL